VRPRALTRPARAVATGAALLGLVLSATSCNVGRPPAATVAGREIPAERIDDLVAAFVEADPDTFGPQIEGEGEGTYAMAAVAVILSSLVVQSVQTELADRLGVGPDGAERTEAEGLVRNSFAPGADAEPDPATGEPTEEAAQAQETSGKVFDALSKETREWLIDLRATTLALTRELAKDAPDPGEQARQIYDADPSVFESLCLRAAVVATADAAPVQARLDAGEDLGAVSAEVSTNPEIAGAQGDLGCVLVSDMPQYFPEEIISVVSTLEPGVVSEGVELPDDTTAWFELTQRVNAPFENVQEQIVATLPDPAEAALADLVQEEIGGIDVDVDPRFGTWDAETGTITPPDGARGPETDVELIDGGTPTVPAGG